MDTTLTLHNERTRASFCVDLRNPKDLANLHAIIHELYPDRLCSFLQRPNSSDALCRYPIDIIKEVFSQTPERTEEHRLLCDILCTTFGHARLLMHSAWDETMAVFATTDLKRLTALSTILDDCSKHAQWKISSAHDLFSTLGVHALSIDALTALLRRDGHMTQHHQLRMHILSIAQQLIRNLEPGLFVDRERSQELYHRCDLNGNTIAHHIADGTLFPGAEQITFDPIRDETILALTNFAGKTVGEGYLAHLRGEVQAPTPLSL